MKNTDNQPFAIFTIGHGNRKAEDFVYLLKKYDIQALIDVRTIPFSRFHVQFRKSQLDAILKRAGIQYLFLGEALGGRPKNPDLYLNGKVSYPAIRNTTEFKNGIAQVVQLVENGIKVTLMCSESDQNECHRKHLIADELIGKGLDVIHINKTGNLEIHTSEIMLNLFD
jgi:uncharacterized protein (DUF488 family)